MARLITATDISSIALRSPRAPTRWRSGMRVFVTGASGHIGSALIPELLQAGHEVVGLARSDEAAGAVQSAGGEVHRGDLDDLDNLREAAAAADGVIHLAFKHDAMRAGDYDGAVTADLHAIQAI